MRRFFPFLLLPLLLLAAPAVAADVCGGEPAVTVLLPVDPPVDSPELGIPQPVPQTCTAELDCEDGNVISCTGNSTCIVNQFNGTVACDGDETQCPNFCRATLQHDCGSCGTYFCFCTSLKGDCQVGGGGVTCDGFFRFCRCPFGCS